ncbi:MAG: HEAT repeat domain-containing protein [Spirochaetales bacterium]|nr:HEAT repeat domain-containing protein [Spirochaetales bacterium]
MKMIIKSLLYITFILCLGMSVLAQDSDDKEKTATDLYLQNPELMIAYEQAQADDRQSKIQSLDGLEKMIKDGIINTEIENILIQLGSEGGTSKMYEGRTVVNNFPEVRRRACNLLGEMAKDSGGASEEIKLKAVDTLINILKSDNEPMVKSEAAYALGVIGLEINGKVVQALAFEIETAGSVQPDNNFAYAVILALDKIAKKNNGAIDPAGYRALIKIAQGNYLKHVRTKAYDTMVQMKSYK